MTGFSAVWCSTIACVISVDICAAVVVNPGAVGAFAAMPLAMGFMVTIAWRFHRTALVISDIGVRVRWLPKTRTVRWGEINGFRFGPDLLGVDRLWIDLADGGRIRTPVQRVRRMFSLVSDGGTWLLYNASDDLLHVLEQRLQAGEASL